MGKDPYGYQYNDDPSQYAYPPQQSKGVKAANDAANTFASAVPPLGGFLAGARLLFPSTGKPVTLARDKAMQNIQEQILQKLENATPEQWQQFQAAIPNLPSQLQGWARGLQPNTNTAKDSETRFRNLEGLAKAATDQRGINNIFGFITDNIRRAQGGATGAASARAGAFASQGNVLNRGRYVNAAANEAARPYVSALGEAEVSRAGALQKSKMDYFEFMRLIDAARRGEEWALKELAMKEKELALREKQTNAMIEANEATWMDYAPAFASVLGIKTGADSTLGGDVWNKIFGK